MQKTIIAAAILAVSALTANAQKYEIGKGQHQFQEKNHVGNAPGLRQNQGCSDRQRPRSYHSKKSERNRPCAQGGKINANQLL